MTGILPIKKYGEHSAINLFDEYSVTDPKNFSQHFGFTEKEVEDQCFKYGVDFAEMKKWYDGYQLGEFHIYNPKSVVDALTLTLLIHLGYLTYDEHTESVFFPNQEIAQEFIRAIKVGGWGNLMESLNRSEQLLKSTWEMCYI